MITKYRKAPVIVEAVQLRETDASIIEVVNFAKGGQFVLGTFLSDTVIFNVKRDGGVLIHTLDGTMLASFGDYVIKHVTGDVYQLKPDIFEKTYQKVEEETTAADVEEKYGQAVNFQRSLSEYQDKESENASQKLRNLFERRGNE